MQTPVTRFKAAAMRGIAICTLCLCGSTSALPLGSFDRVFVFGDSVSDNGNVALAIPTRTETPYTSLLSNLLVPTAPYDVSNNFSNGPV